MLGTIEEMMPIAVTGISFSSINLISRINKNKTRIIFFSIIILYFLFKFDIFKKFEGYVYPDILLNDFSSIFLFIIFSLISLEQIKKKIYIIFLKNITKFTGGIYFLKKILTIIYITKKNNI